MFFRFKALSISKRIALTYAIILFSILVIFSTLLPYILRSMFLSSSEEEFTSAATKMEDYMKNHDDFARIGIQSLNLSYAIIYNIYDEQGHLLCTNRPGFIFLDIPPKAKSACINEQMIGFETPVLFLNKITSIHDTKYCIQVIKIIESMGIFPRAVGKITIFTSIVGSILSLLSGVYLSRKLLKPIRNITKTAKELTSKSLNKRIPIDGPDDEIKDLAKTFNLMLERLEADFEKQRRFIYDASHELRTPLAVIYGNITMLNRWGKENPEVLSKALSILKNEAESINKLIANLLYLARSDSNTLVLRFEDFSLNKLLKEVVDETLLIHSDYTVSYICDNDYFLIADYNAIKQVLRILLDNAAKYSAPPGDIVIEIILTPEGTIISVMDKGFGIPQESLPYIFDRFYRADQSRTKATGGTGLGLAIAKQIIQCHQGTISAQSTLNDGTKIEIFIPKQENI